MNWFRNLILNIVIHLTRLYQQKFCMYIFLILEFLNSLGYSHCNVFGRSKKLNLLLKRGQIDSLYHFNYTDPWIDGDNKRTSRTVMVQV
jgi:hypothetical protein